MYLTLIFLPILGSIISGFFGRKVGTTGAQLITSIFMFITTFLALIIFFEVGFNNIPVYIKLTK
jgi:NADH-ubiquinone oxidoreductase chain 5